MDKYRKVQPQSQPPAENEVRVSSRSIIGGVITYIQNTFTDKKFKTMEITATSTAIDKAVKIALYLRKRSKGMSLVTKIMSLTTTDVYDPIEEGLDRVQVERKIPCIKIIASYLPQDSKDPGYLAPLPDNEIQANYARPERDGPQRGRFRRGRGRGRGRFGNRRNNYRNYNRYYEDNNENREGDSYGDRRRGGFRRRRPQRGRYYGYNQRQDS